MSAPRCEVDTTYGGRWQGRLVYVNTDGEAVVEADVGGGRAVVEWADDAIHRITWIECQGCARHLPPSEVNPSRLAPRRWLCLECSAPEHEQPQA